MPSTSSSQHLEDELRTVLASKDNLLQAFFVLLWSKTADSGTALSGIRIPDTAVLNHSRVIEYYFTSVKDGTIKKKSKVNQTTAHLLEELAKKSRKNTVSGMAATLISRDTTRASGVSLEPLTFEETRHMLERESSLTGTIQGFIDPHSEGGKHFMHDISISWTPNLFYAEKRVSPLQIPKATIASSKATSSSFSSRQAWFNTDDDNPGVTATTGFSSYTSRELERMCVLIAQHIEGAYRMRLMGIDLHAVIDSKDQLWITYCSGIRVSKLEAPTCIIVDIQMRSVSHPARNHNGNSGVGLRGGGSEPTPFRSASSATSSASVNNLPVDSSASDVGGVVVAASDSRRASVLRKRLPPSSSTRVIKTLPPKKALSSKKPLFCFCKVCTSSNMPPTVEEVEEGVAPDEPFSLDDSMRPFAEVARKHLQFSLSVLSFFASNKPGTVYVDESIDPSPSSVPAYVQLMRLNEFREGKLAPVFYERLRALGIRKTKDGRPVPGWATPTSRSATPPAAAAGSDFGGSMSASYTPPPVPPQDEVIDSQHGDAFNDETEEQDDSAAEPEEVTVEEYLQFRDTDAWLDERIMVCDECAGELTGVVEDTEIGKDGKIRVPANAFPSNENASPVRLGHFATATTTSQQRQQKEVVEPSTNHHASPYASRPKVGAGAEVAHRAAKQKAVPTPSTTATPPSSKSSSAINSAPTTSSAKIGEEVQASRSRVVVVSTPDGGEEEATSS